MATEPIQGLPYPLPSDAPDGPNQIKALADAVAPRLVMRFASTAARDAAIPSPIDGMECWTGTTRWARISGTWVNVTPVGVWTTYTPTIGGLNVGSGTVLGRYRQDGKTVDAYVEATLGAGFSIGATLTTSLPAAARATNSAYRSLGTAFFYQPSALAGGIVTRSGSNAQIWQINGAPITATSPWTWAAGHMISWTLRYEAA